MNFGTVPPLHTTSHVVEICAECGLVIGDQDAHFRFHTKLENWLRAMEQKLEHLEGRGHIM